MQFRYYTDPGHGWVKVPRSLLEVLDIEGKISRYSYARGESVYLEEDCDYGILVKALENRGTKHSLARNHTNRSSKIRSYNSFIA